MENEQKAEVIDNENVEVAENLNDEPVEQVEEQETLVSDDDPKSIKKRLGMQGKKYRREIKALHERLSQMQEALEQKNNQDSYSSPGQPDPQNMSEEQRIEQAVRMAFGMQEQQKKKAEEQQSMAHVQKQYQRLNSEFDKASEKYEDFDDVVRGDDAPFTSHVRDALLLIDNPAEVAYKLGKNRGELERISKLHPVDQLREVNKLSFSLMSDKGEKSKSQQTTPMGSVRANPVNSSVNGKTSPAEIRARMKAGTWK